VGPGLAGSVRISDVRDACGARNLQDQGGQLSPASTSPSEGRLGTMIGSVPFTLKMWGAVEPGWRSPARSSEAVNLIGARRARRERPTSTKTLALIAGGVLLVWAAPVVRAEAPAGPRSGAQIPSWLIPAEVDALSAKAEFRNPEGGVVGRAELVEAPYGVMIAVEVSELPPGRHGFHIHEAGRCDPPDFGSAGGHFNPRGKRHGLMTVDGPHVGDLPNLVAGPDGTVRAEFYLTHATLGAGSNSLFHPNGTALVIHADPDDGRTDRSGHAGPRIACAVIGFR